MVAHKVGDLVCWSEYVDLIGYIKDYSLYKDTGYLYVVEWNLDCSNPSDGLFKQTTHTDSGITNLKRYLQIRLNMRQS